MRFLAAGMSFHYDPAVKNNWLIPMPYLKNNTEKNEQSLQLEMPGQCHIFFCGEMKFDKPKEERHGKRAARIYPKFNHKRFCQNLGSWLRFGRGHKSALIEQNETRHLWQENASWNYLWQYNAITEHRGSFSQWWGLQGVEMITFSRHLITCDSLRRTVHKKPIIVMDQSCSEEVLSLHFSLPNNME